MKGKIIMKGKMSILERIKQIIKKNKTAQNQIIIKEISKKIAQQETNKASQSALSENKHQERRKSSKNISNKAKGRQSKNAELKNINMEDEAADFGNWDISEFQVEEKEGMLRFHDLGFRNLFCQKV